MKLVLFAGIHNAGRSQMAAAWFNALADRSRASAIGLRHLDWPLENPKGKPIERVREIRDEVKQRVLGLLEAEGWR